MKKGLRKFGNKAEAAMGKELSQLHNCEAFAPVRPTPAQRRAALESIMTVKEKRDGTIKGRHCADGRKQRGAMTKEETTSPTVALESLLLVTVIAAKEGRAKGVVDLPGAYLSTPLTGDEVIMTLQGTLAEMMVLSAPEIYRDYVTLENGKKVLYVRLKKALYGLLKSALLFYRKLWGDLAHRGFELNPYDPCVANKMINGHQMTICWHVDDLFMSHKETKVIQDFVGYLECIYGKLAVTIGDEIDYLGMHFKFVKDQVKIGMEDFTLTIIEEFPELIDIIAEDPAGQKLFVTREPSDKNPLLGTKLAQSFHRSVAQLLYLCTRARWDIRTAVAFLTTRVRAPD